MQIIRRYLAGIIVVVCLLSSVFSMQSRQVAVYLPMQANTEMESVRAGFLYRYGIGIIR